MTKNPAWIEGSRRHDAVVGSAFTSRTRATFISTRAARRDKKPADTECPSDCAPQQAEGACIPHGLGCKPERSRRGRARTAALPQLRTERDVLFVPTDGTLGAVKGKRTAMLQFEAAAFPVFAGMSLSVPGASWPRCRHGGDDARGPARCRARSVDPRGSRQAGGYSNVNRGGGPQDHGAGRPKARFGDVFFFFGRAGLLALLRSRWQIFSRRSFRSAGSATCAPQRTGRAPAEGPGAREIQTATSILAPDGSSGELQRPDRQLPGQPNWPIRSTPRCPTSPTAARRHAERRPTS